MAWSPRPRASRRISSCGLNGACSSATSNDPVAPALAPAVRVDSETVRSRRPRAIGSIRWSMPRIHAGRSHSSRARSSAARTTAQAPSVIGGQSFLRSGSTIGSSASRSCSEMSHASWAFGLSMALRRLRAATSAKSASVALPASSSARAWRAARLMASGQSGATWYGSSWRDSTSWIGPGSRLAVAVDERGVDVAELELHPGLVQRPGAVHLDVALLDRRPGADAVEGRHEAERLPGEVVGRAGAGEADLLLVEPGALAHVLDDRHEHLDLVADGLLPHVGHLGEGDDGDVPHQVTPSPGCVTAHVGLAVGTEVPDALEVGRQIGVVDPHGLDPHADVDVLHRALLDEVHERQVGAVEEDQPRRVRDLHPLAVEGHVHHAEADQRADVGQLHLLGGGHAQLRVGAAGGDVDLPAPAPARRGSSPGRSP